MHIFVRGFSNVKQYFPSTHCILCSQLKFTFVDKCIVLFKISTLVFKMEAATSHAPGKTPHGKRLMISIIEHHASVNPEKIFISIPAGNRVIDGQQDISFGVFAGAVNRCAWWIERTLGGRGVDFPPIATYMYPMDFRHVILTFAAIKAGFRVFTSRQTSINLERSHENEPAGY